MSENNDDMGESANLKSLKRTVFFRLALFVVIMGLMFFLPAGTIKYWAAWIYIGIIIFPMLLVFRYFIKRDPELLERRMRHREKEKEQKLIIRLSGLYFFAAFVLPGFDYRFGWSDVSGYIIILADIVILIGYFIFALVLRENSFASRIIEVEEDQKVISTGPYSIVRHPMYSGVLIMYLLSPVALASYWAVIPASLLLPLIIFRVINEEKVLIHELKGYKEYKQKVKYRIIPGIW